MTLTPESKQVEILLKVQRLLIEGGFVASYKFALLQAALDIAVEIGDDSDATLRVPINRIAEKFIQYYWRQVIPYVPGRRPREVAGGGIVSDRDERYAAEPRILHQITAPRATILELVRDSHRRFGGSLASARADRRTWVKLVTGVGRIVREMPLWKLQTVSGGDDDFLYANCRGENVTEIELRPGVAFTLRQFHGLLQELVRSAWVRFVRRLERNRAILGDSEDLHEFLFGSERASLEPYKPILRDVQEGRCFYCARPLTARTEHVDHFVPWSRYPVDLAHNFVLTDSSCNDSKSDLLASVDHLERWSRRNAAVGEELAQRASTAGTCFTTSRHHVQSHAGPTSSPNRVNPKYGVRARRPRSHWTGRGGAFSCRPKGGGTAAELLSLWAFRPAPMCSWHSPLSG